MLVAEDVLGIDIGLALEAIDLVVAGRRVEPGERILCLLGAANRDPAVFERAEVMDVTRKDSRMLSFGGGIHHCIGQQLARLEGRIAFAALARRLPQLQVATAEAAIQWAKAFGELWWAPLLLMAAYTPACLVMFPRPLITLAAVLAFGPLLGFTYSLLGICASAAVTWWMGRHMRRDTVRRLAGPKLDRMIDVLKKHGLVAMTLLRLVPIAPFAVESIVAGAIGMKLWHVVLGTAIGLLPGTLTTTVFGDAIETAVTGAGEVNWWLVGAAVTLLAGGAWGVKRWFTRMERRMRAHAETGRQPS